MYRTPRVGIAFKMRCEMNGRRHVFVGFPAGITNTCLGPRALILLPARDAHGDVGRLRMNKTLDPHAPIEAS
jgi:hypothetical protein